DGMTMVDEAVTGAFYIEAPRDVRIKALYDYWDGLRCGRKMPSRADVDPAAIPSLLPHIIMHDVQPGGGYTIRLVGEAVVDFVGRNGTGRPAGSMLPPHAVDVAVAILDAVTSERAPKFRAGKAHWQPDKNYRDFEACFLPLSNDGE